MMVNLGDVAHINPRGSDALHQTELISFVPMASLSAEEARVMVTETKTYSEVSKGYTPFRSGDILVAKITPCFENGKIAQAHLPLPNGFGSTEFHVIRPKDESLDGRYLHHFLRQEHIRVEGERRMTGSGGQRRVPPSFLSSLRIFVPCLEAQRRIAAILDQADALRAKRREALALLDELQRGIFIEMFGEPSHNPHGWPTAQLSELVAPDDSINYGVVQPGEDVEGGVPLVRVGDLVDGGVCHEQMKKIDPTIEAAYKRSRLKGDEILVSCVGSIGVVALTSVAEQGFNIARAVARIRLSDMHHRVFVATQLRTESVQKYFKQELRTVSQPTLNIKQIAEARLILPPLELQREFASRVKAVEAIKASHIDANYSVESLFSSLQHRAFRGEL